VGQSVVVEGHGEAQEEAATMMGRQQKAHECAEVREFLARVVISQSTHNSVPDPNGNLKCAPVLNPLQVSPDIFAPPSWEGPAGMTTGAKLP
jgi:hypothetical protein